ncbi:hypothetical protein NXV78_15065 [Bacteroides cellulosilyticus]|jgi:hypothetical protein|uniref:hypothetical protein n=1 Tax=Bacteroides TaxID=816 RepID=UPI002166216E|nr:MULTISPECIES: hypothetical protein [Bacteroides]MCS3055336.1 hypothetical protein [Bacteroides cellulosilyticus]
MKTQKLIRRLEVQLHQYLKSLGTVQIPHHGAKRNFNPSILILNSTSVISYQRNDPKHPNPSVLRDIATAYSTIISVIDDINTEFIEKGYY